MLASLATKTGRSKAAAQPLGQRGVVPAQVGGVEDHASGVHDARGADADAEHRPGRPRRRARGPARARASTASWPRRPSSGRLAALLDRRRQVDQGAGDEAVGGEVDRDDLPGLLGELHQHRRLADPALHRRRGLGEQPSATRSPTRSETVTRVSPLDRARSARLAGP